MAEEKHTLTEWRSRGLFDAADEPDAAEAERRKKAALAQIQHARKHVVGGLREAMYLILKGGKVEHVTSDNARHVYEHQIMPVAAREYDCAPPAFKSFAGPLFSGDKRFVATGQYVKSRYPKNHSAVIMCWRLREGA